MEPCDHPYNLLVLVRRYGRDPDVPEYLVHCNGCALDFGEPIQVRRWPHR